MTACDMCSAPSMALNADRTGLVRPLCSSCTVHEAIARGQRTGRSVTYTTSSGSRVAVSIPREDLPTLESVAAEAASPDVVGELMRAVVRLSDRIDALTAERDEWKRLAELRGEEVAKWAHESGTAKGALLVLSREVIALKAALRRAVDLALNIESVGDRATYRGALAELRKLAEGA